VTTLLPHEEAALRVYNAFSIHRQQVIDEFWDESEFVNLRAENTIEVWSPATKLLRRLWRHLRFGRYLTPEDYNDIINNLFRVKEDAREQLFFWHTAGPLASPSVDANPIESLTILQRTNHFWYSYIAPIQQQVKDHILAGRRIRYLERFYLDYDFVELAFSEIRLSPVQFGDAPPPNPTPYRLVIVPGREHTFRWNTNFWETGLESPDSNLTNPTYFTLPPVAIFTPEEEEEFRVARNIPTPPLLRRNPQITVTIPPAEPLINRISTAISDSIDTHVDSSPTTPFEESRYPACWCSTDVCYCHHRPETPPTPPGITLWTPGDRHLPNNRT
jgi:hypothetical protein